MVGKFVEFFGPGLASLTVADRATLGNMSPEYGSTVAICPIDGMTLDYLRLTGRDAAQVALVEAYAKAQGLFAAADEPLYTDVVELDLATVEPSLAGPKRPQDRVPLHAAKAAFAGALEELAAGRETPAPAAGNGAAAAPGVDDGAVVIAAITSCTNTSNPSRHGGRRPGRQKARSKLGLSPVKPWVKTSLAPGSQGGHRVPAIRPG